MAHPVIADEAPPRSVPTVLQAGVVVAGIQATGAACRFGFQIALATALVPYVYADVAVALSWSQVLAAAGGGGSGAYLLAALPRLLTSPGARPAATYRAVQRSSALAIAAASGLVAAGLVFSGTAGGTAVGVAVLGTTALRSALFTVQESLRATGSLVLSQVLTLLVSPLVSTAIVVAAVITMDGTVDPVVAPLGIAVGLVVAWLPGRRVLGRSLGHDDGSDPAAPPVRTPVWQVLRLGLASAMLVWMFEGPVVLAGVALGGGEEVAQLNIHVRLSMVTALAAVVVSTVASSHWASRARSTGALPTPREALSWSMVGAAAATAAAVVLFAVGPVVVGAFGEGYAFSPVLLAGLAVKDTALAAASPLFYFLATHGNERGASRAASLGGAALLTVVPLAATHGLGGASLGVALGGTAWLAGFAYQVVRTGDR